MTSDSEDATQEGRVKMASGSEHGLKRIVWQKLKDTIIADCRKADIWKILILDPFTTKLVSSCCKMSDLMAEGITIVEDLYKSREPVPEMKAIYFMSPTSKCVDAFIADFKLKPKYKAAYVYFTDYCPDDLFNNMKLYCAKYIRVVKEINMSFLPYEAQVFTCDNPGAFRSIYSPHSQSGQRKTHLGDQCKTEIVNLCPHWEKTRKGSDNKKESNMENTKALAELVDNKLAAHYELEEPGKKKEKTQAQVLIVERGFDPVSPILHELTYQAMAYDLIDIQNETYKAPLLSFIAGLPVVQVQVLKTDPEKGGLGLNEDAPRLALGVLFDPSSGPCCPFLAAPTTAAHDKIRAVLLYIFSLSGTTEENLNKLIQNVKIEHDREFILNWKELGVNIISAPSLFSRKPSRRERPEETYNLSRWTPVIKDVMEDAVENKLDTKEWPHQSECPAAWNGSGAVSARQKQKTSTLDDRRGGARLIVFVIGGVCYSETRCAYQVSQAVKSCQVIIGSSHILTPTALLEDIKALSKGPMETFTICENHA
ncbi:syntaxin-binding protein 3-like [Gadus chalcogrammus]|uniref:syntaxin-binding protein 3-like n=1 Tax=Gadus chalcogrammus TaxID=1042646 RepID=UPI0024C4CB53|nr:syntaxin-binding protein 3-like [Gadus chalcogrammus]